MELWTQLLATIGTIIGAIVPIIVILDKRANDREKKKQEREKSERENLIKDSVSAAKPVWEKHVDEKLEGFVTTEEGKQAHNGIRDELKKLTEKIEENQSIMIDSEKSRIRGEILSFAEDLRNGADKSSVAYQHIHLVYSRYKELGGNSYIDKVFSYIVSIQDADANKKNND